VLPAAIVTTAFGVGIYTFFYEFVLKGISNYHIWFLTLRTIWRAKLFDRLLTVGGRS
jgi:hypothetical protein